MKYLLLLFFMTQTFAYELVSFSTSRIRLPDELLNEVKMTREEIKNYHCEDKTRFDLFTKSIIQNMNKDSLKVIGANGVIYTYQDQALLDSKGKIQKIKDPYLKQVQKTLNRFETIPELRTLVEELQFARFPFYIKKGRNSYMPSNPGDKTYFYGNHAGFISMLDDLRPMIEGLPFNEIGFGGMIYWNPATKAFFVEEDYKIREVDVDLILAHEMYHAYDGLRGLLDRRFVKDEGHEFSPVCEFRAVYLENLVRKSWGYKYRRYYGDPKGDFSGPDMLDDSDQPILIPTPCISWL